MSLILLYPWICTIANVLEVGTSGVREKGWGARGVRKGFGDVSYFSKEAFRFS